MTYISGSVTDANPGPALYALMAPALTTAGLTLIDTVVISTRTHKIWKSAAAGNAQNLDWYLDVAYTTTGAGTFTITAFEFFDPATDLGYRGPVYTGGTTIDAVTGSRYGATGSALETNWFNASMTGAQVAVGTGAFGYWISITVDRVILLVGGSPDIVMYAGFYEPDPLYAAKAGSLLYPLVSGRVLGGTTYNGTLVTAGLTRIPPLTAFTAVGWATTLQASPTSLGGYPALPAVATAAYPIPAFRNQLTASLSVTPENRIGRYGWSRDCYIVPSVGVIRGDTCTINGASYVLSTTSALCSVAFKAV